MKILSAFLIFSTLIFTNCSKSGPSISEETETNVITKAPFENNQFKMERASINLPQNAIKIHFFDETNGICLADGGMTPLTPSIGFTATTAGIFTTNDRGLTWTLSFTLAKSNNFIRPMGFEVMDNKTVVAFIGGSRVTSTDDEIHTNILIRSADRGKTWTTTTIKNTYLCGLTRSTDNLLYALGQNGTDSLYTSQNTFLSSKDGGLTWDRSVINIPFSPIGNIFSLGSKKLVILSDYCNLDNYRYNSADNGLNWQFNKGGIEYILGISYSDKIGYNLSNVNTKLIYNIYQTTDGGEKWMNIRTFTNQITEVKALSPTAAIILGREKGNNNAGFYYTSDAGKTWTDMTILDNLDSGQLIASSFYTPKDGYIVASKNVLYRISFK
jgi:photosystem II stability/assembly factor-like uncharacterized protein